MGYSSGIQERGLRWCATKAGKRCRAFDQPPDVFIGAHLAREVVERLGQILARRYEFALFEREAGAEIEDARRHRWIAQIAEQALGLVQIRARGLPIACAPVRATQREGAGSRAKDIMFAREEVVDSVR